LRSPLALLVSDSTPVFRVLRLEVLFCFGSSDSGQMCWLSIWNCQLSSTLGLLILSSLLLSETNLCSAKIGFCLTLASYTVSNFLARIFWELHEESHNRCWVKQN
jgi:hypothetical protein